MRTLMISLDVKLLQPHSAVAARLCVLGTATHHIDIIVPHAVTTKIVLSDFVTVYGVAGNKIQQFLAIITLGKKLRQTIPYDVITTQDPFFTAVCGLLIRTREIMQVQVHGDFFNRIFYTHNWKNYGYYWLARIVVLPRAQKIRVVGERVKQSLLALGVSDNRIEKRPVTLVPEAQAGFTPLKNIRQEFVGFRKYFVYAGRLEAEKNVAWLVEVFMAYLTETKQNDCLIMCGSGSEQAQLQKIITARRWQKNIIIAGYTARPLDYIKTADCLLVPSRAEGYCLVAMEAHRLGTPVIMTDVGVANYELLPSEKVSIVPVDNRAAFVTALKKI